MLGNIASRWLAIALGAMPTVGLITGASYVAWAETPAAGPTVRISPVIVAEPEVETTLVIQVGPEALVPRQTFLRIRGIPLSAKLSDGHIVSPGVWAVPLTALSTLRLHAPLSSSGRSEITLALVSVDGGILAEARSSLVVAPSWLLGSSGPREVQRAPAPVRETQPTTPPLDVAAAATQDKLQAAPTRSLAPVAPPAEPPPAQSQPLTQPVVTATQSVPVRQETAPPAKSTIAALPPPPPVPAPVPKAALPSLPPAVAAPPAPPPKAAPALSQADRSRAEQLVQRGEGFLAQGNLAAARQFFRRAADIGLALGALRLGATYDPNELRSMSVVGVQPDLKEARIWYERARELGASEANARLTRLGER